ncbi:lipoate-protein ligase A [Paraburkholderia atlantica]|uniref:lipoyl protein ligase domain-containing protein n=1 Tax=Paraburkholderia atlantica TaxID=2654982 RepID=UPI00128D22F0|nr:lipoate--protein ligase family protein [Paraburkholderia atlantica]MPW05143.1 lipoate--protein ligase family protein [Paraburkholderia atlantica]
MTFEFIKPDPTVLDPLQAEHALLDLAARGRTVAQLWEAPKSLVVPRSYLRYPEFESARSAFLRGECPVWLRMSGGGLVPQGPGILNLSLAYFVAQQPSKMSDAVYLHLCEVIGSALRVIGVTTHHQAVDGSFCDGRFNLAWGASTDARKIAGTAQYWRRAPAAMRTCDGQGHLVLAHAVLLVSADPDEANQRANAFEEAVGSGRRYEANKIVTVQQALGGAVSGSESVMTTVLAAIKDSLTGIPLPTNTQ